MTVDEPPEANTFRRHSIDTLITKQLDDTSGSDDDDIKKWEESRRVRDTIILNISVTYINYS